jgi:hypothetical protein
MAWTKNSPRLLEALLVPLEVYFLSSKKGNADPKSVLYMELSDSLGTMAGCMPMRLPDVTKRIEKILSVAAAEGTSGVVNSDRSATESLSGSEADGKSAYRSDSGRGKTSTRGPRINKGGDSGCAGVDKSSSEFQNMKYPTEATATGYAMPRVWRYEGGESSQDEHGNYRRLIPLHPTNFFVRQPGQPHHTVPRLLDTWPSYLERLNGSQGNGLGRSFSAMSASDRMHVVYESNSAAGKGLMSRAATPVPYQVPAGGTGPSFEHTLTFDSEFESGNILRAVQRGDANYDLFLRADLHTAGHTQWFYFSVANTHPQALVRLSEQGVQVPPVRVRFNIVNFTKPDSLFNLGMRPVVYSCLDAATKNVGWLRGGSDISYYSNSYARNNTAGEGVSCYYTLSFTIEFQNAKDTTMIAYSYPYTHSDYKAHISHILSKPNSGDYIKQSRLCHTLSGEDCDLLVITNFRTKGDRDRIGPINLANAESYRSDEAQKRMGGTMGRPSASSKESPPTLKPAFFLSCRVHPGETPASWMMKGALDFLTSDCAQAQMLRQTFVIFVVPMLNPDGVIYGNNRCSLAGVDLNRQWKIPMKGLHPTVFHLKALMQAQRRLREVLCYVDLHGHSRKYNVFMYGCDEKSKKSRAPVRSFPRLFSMHHIGKKYVCYSDCSFHIRKGRESTARVVVAREMNISCSYTLEATFCGSNYGPLKHCHMHTGHLQETGAALCDTILNFAISEGRVQDALLVPANVKAVAEMEAIISDEDGTSSNGQAIAIMNENRTLFDSLLASHLQNQQKNQRGKQQQQQQQQRQQQQQQQSQYQQNVFAKIDSSSPGSGSGPGHGDMLPAPQGGTGYAQLRNPNPTVTQQGASMSSDGGGLPGMISGGVSRSSPGTADTAIDASGSGSAAVGGDGGGGGGDTSHARPNLVRSQSGPEPAAASGNYSVGFEGAGAGMGDASGIGEGSHYPPSGGSGGHNYPPNGGSGGLATGADLDSDSDMGGGASDSDSIRTNGPSDAAAADGGDGRRPRELPVGLFRSNSRNSMMGSDSAGGNYNPQYPHGNDKPQYTGHAEQLRRSDSGSQLSSDGQQTLGSAYYGNGNMHGKSQAQAQAEEFKRQMPSNMAALMSSTLPMPSSSGVDMGSSSILSTASDGRRLMMKDGGDDAAAAAAAAVAAAAAAGGSGSALKAAGYRVMDDMALSGSSVGGGSRGTFSKNGDNGGGRAAAAAAGGGGRGVDSSTVTSPVKASKKKKSGLKGSSSAKSSRNSSN